MCYFYNIQIDEFSVISSIMLLLNESICMYGVGDVHALMRMHILNFECICMRPFECACVYRYIKYLNVMCHKNVGKITEKISTKGDEVKKCVFFSMK